MAEAPEPVTSSNDTLTLKDLSSELEPVVDWYTLGIKLGVEDHKLKEIEEQYHDPQRRKCEVLSRWLRKGHNCTWRRVVEVLMQMGEMVAADTIKLKYLTLTTGPQTPPEPASPVVAAVVRRNRMIIGRKWGALVALTDEVLQDKLDSKEITSNRFRLFLGNLYSCEGKIHGHQFLRKLLKPSASISEMLETLTVEGEWDFINYYLLESIIEEYGDDRTREMMEQYKQDLTGYLLVTKIKDHLDAVDTEHPTIPPEELYSSLTVKVKGVNISSQSLEYVNDLWESLRKQFSLPKHILVLYKIAKGCLEISWCAPVQLAAYIIRKAKESEQYFEEQQFLQVSVDGVHIYNKSEAGVQLKDKEHISKQYNKKDKSDRQFACEDCDVVWWAYVPKDNPVTLCPVCSNCYKALKRWDQYGYADFECSCGLKFEGSDRFYKWSSIECPKCNEIVKPSRIRRPHRKPLTVKRPSALTLSPFTTKDAVQKNVHPRQISDKHSGSELVGGTRKPQEQKQIPQSLTKDAQEILTRWPKSSRSASVEDTTKKDDTSEASSVHPKPLHHPFTLKHAGKPIASPFQHLLSDLEPELLRSQEEKSKPTQRYQPPISRSKYQMKKQRELQRKLVSRRRKFSTRMNCTSNFARKNGGTQPVGSEVGEQDKGYAPKIAKVEQLSEPSNQQLPTEQSKRLTAMRGGELPEVVQKLFQTLGEIPASSSIAGPSDTAATVNSGEFSRESSHIAGSSASGFSPNVLKKLKLLEEPPEAGNLVPDAELNGRKGSMEASLTSRPLLHAFISSSSTTETTITKHSTADIRFMPTALSETHNFLTASETGTKQVFTSAAMRETGSKSTSQNSFQETVLEVDPQGGSSCTTPSVHTHTAQHPRESNVKGGWTDIECLPSLYAVHAHHRTTPSVFTERELPHPSPPQVRTRTKKRPRYLSKFKDKDQKIRRNVYIASKRHNCTGDTDDETRSAGLQARPVVFEFKQEIFHHL